MLGYTAALLRISDHLLHTQPVLHLHLALIFIPLKTMASPITTATTTLSLHFTDSSFPIQDNVLLELEQKQQS